jgi:glycosyltransferase involved in cell wall biosynthesis
MRLMHIISSLNIGGAEKLLLDLVERQIKNNLTIHVHILKRTNSFLEKAFFRLKCNLSFGKGNPYNPRQFFELKKQIESFQPDIVHAHLTPAQVWSALVGHDNLVTTEHNTYNRRRNWFFKPLDFLMYTRFRKIACITSATKLSLITWNPSVARKVVVIHNGVDLAKFKKRVRTNTAIQKIIMIARFEPQKDQDTLIKALARHANLNLILVGDGIRRNQLEDLVRLNEIEDRVHFLGQRDNIPELLSSSDIYIHSVHWEGFGIAVVEAMASGLPVIISDVPGLRDVAGDAGILFEPGNVQQLVERIQNLIDNDKLWNEKIMLSLKQASKFSIEATVSAYHSFYRQLLES